VDYS